MNNMIDDLLRAEALIKKLLEPVYYITSEYVPLTDSEGQDVFCYKFKPPYEDEEIYILHPKHCLEFERLMRSAGYKIEKYNTKRGIEITLDNIRKKINQEVRKDFIWLNNHQLT